MDLPLVTPAERLALRIQVASADDNVINLKLAIAVLTSAANEAADDGDFAEQSLLEKRSDALVCLLEAAKEERLRRLRAFQTAYSSLDPLVKAQDDVAFTEQERLRLYKFEEECKAFLTEHVQDVITESEWSFCISCCTTRSDRNRQDFFAACHQEASLKRAARSEKALTQPHIRGPPSSLTRGPAPAAYLFLSAPSWAFIQTHNNTIKPPSPAVTWRIYPFWLTAVRSDLNLMDDGRLLKSA
ncbi:hypothetical protein HDU90_005143 [Geranomyces variabilis]|nr:hypothetical protein HDU90_005143 [Geranomyces variabilis]